MSGREDGTVGGLEPGTLSLYADILKSGSSLRVRVTGSSMTPFIRGGDIVIIRRTPAARLRVGDLVFYMVDRGSAILHRIVGIKSDSAGSRVFMTRGDAKKSGDGPVHQDRILGKVIRIDRTGPGKRLRSICMESFIWRNINLAIAYFRYFSSVKNRISRMVKR